MPRIHPTAIIDPSARIAEDVEVGPGCDIGPGVTVGPGCRLVGHVYLRGPLVLGAGNVIYPFACIGLEPQDRKYDPARPGSGAVIGDGNIIREGVTIHRATGARPTTLGSRNFLMVNCHLAHDCLVGNGCVLANGVLLAGHVTLEDRVIVGGNAAVHQFCRVGRLAMLSGTVGIVQDLPPFCVAYSTRRVSSLNLIGLRRAGYRAHIRPLSEAFRVLFRERRSMASALPRIEARFGGDPLVMEMVRFIRASKRGICPYRRAEWRQTVDVELEGIEVR